jgi:RNA polymerase sigma factor (TIGR02999 family)
MDADTTQLLIEAREGDRGSFDLLFARVYDELRDVARERLRHHEPGGTLDTTGLVHEAYLKLVRPEVASAADRAHFLALASRAMRFILVDHARARRMQKRGSGQPIVSLDEASDAAAATPSSDAPAVDLLELDSALTELRNRSERQGQIVEYRFFGGLTYQEIAEVTGLSLRTVKREWTRARAWLYTFMQAAHS